MGNQRGSGLHLIFVCAFLFAVTFTCLGDRNASVICSEQERLALLNFKDNVYDEFGMLSSWVGYECCLWERIHCDGVTGKVESLHLRGDYYVGEGYNYIVSNEVSSSLAELSHLKYLDLSGNDFGWSRIPEFIGSFKQLSYLNLSQSGFVGIIPHQIGNLSNLKVLDLHSFGALMADDMAWISGLSSLEQLDLSSVDIGGAQNRKMVFYMVPSLKGLSLSDCGLSNADLGPFLNSSRILPNVKHLDLGFNYFTSPLPDFFENMSSLTFLDLSYLNLSLAWNFANLLNMVPSLSELHLSDCGLVKTHNLNLSTVSNIQHLELSRNSIKGVFPSVFTNMSSLRVLDLSQNMLNSLVPTMPNLLELYLFGNQLTGPIHAFFGNLSKLDLSFNNLNGSIPESFGNLTALTYLDVSFNRLTGPIPISLGRLVSLQSISLGSNLLNGTIPASIGQLAKLYFLDFSKNSLEGVVSEAHFTNLSMLNYLSVSSNTKLTLNVSREWIPPFQLVTLGLGSCTIGEFPQWLRSQRKLRRLVLSNATISGPLPTWLRKMPIIPELDLSHNKLIGPLTNLPNGATFGRYGVAPVLFLENNFFNGSISRSLCRRIDLKYIDISRNRLTGKIPRCLMNLHGLHTMILSSNQMSGVIPSLVSLKSLRRLKLNDNKFIGKLPRELGNSRYLRILDVGDNKLSGNIPEWVGENLTDLVVLRLHKNNFTGRIPLSLCKASNLHILDVAHNNLKGHIPRCLGELNAMVNESRSGYPVDPSFNYDEGVDQVMKGVHLEYSTTVYMVYNLDLSSNKLVGEIPVELTALSMLVGLNLSNNHLSGHIPDTLGNMSALNSLDLSGNELTGFIPSSMADLTFLSHLNLSHNNLLGRIPTGRQLQTLIDPSIYYRNKDLCGPPLPKMCSNQVDPTTTITSKKKQGAADEKTNVWLFYVDIICGFATGFWGIIGVLLFMKQWRKKLFMFAEEMMDKIYIAVVVGVAKMKRGREAA